ncbi:NAD(P)/FAD-dependent oxidoreductase [Fimbriimonas ginsengisoli]|uniref:Tryptophan halogenase n=1 Tax=Fimbriimonas ginsengisoli Gsoil 348 TaxID=661478 RepID=A0A068NLR1_FIMGI|nr:NAD(P)/FAD-dependent oxidoreductase [Fimbriimonas ginsengisoli]AIE83700.1 tryptophan halogenase [Fimbriimonas ginsengisoli Gsoil 348]
MESLTTDVAIIGGGPSGSTCGGFLKKYQPDSKVLILEREQFPRDHIGESQLPLIGRILDELGVWDRVEAAGFPVKIGGTYRWGTTDDLWDFDFLPFGQFDDAPRPGRYEGQRKRTAFQVDRSAYDKILLDYAEELGCEVRQRSAVREVRRKGDRVEGLVLADGTEIEAKWYVDATGHSGLLRRAMDVEIDEPSSLKNVAGWYYWRNAEWAVSLGVGGTRIQILSLGYGWIWFIPISPDRTSIGFVCPADHYKKSGLSMEELYRRAIAEEPRLQRLIQNATREDRFTTTKDWSFVANRMAGPNWLLVGEAAGFADPILSAGMTLAHAGAREAAFLIMEAARGGNVPWMAENYERRNERRVRQHIRFADYWYKANTNFTDLKEYTSEIARDAGLELSGDQAFQWLGTGGFIEEDMEVAGLALIRLDQLHSLTGRLSEAPATSSLDGYSVFLPHLSGAEQVKVARFENGGVKAMVALRRDGKFLPLYGLFGLMVDALKFSPLLNEAFGFVQRTMGDAFNHELHARLTECLDAMIREGWVRPKKFGEAPAVRHELPMETAAIHQHTPDRGDGV